MRVAIEGAWRVVTGHGVDVSSVIGEGRGGGDGDGVVSSTAGQSDEEVALCILDLGAEKLMVEKDALEIVEDEERGVVDDDVSPTKGKQDHEEQVPRLLGLLQVSPKREGPRA